MSQQKTSDILQDLLIQHFNIAPERFDWDQSLEKLDPNFKVLGYLLFLEQLLEKQFGRKIPLMESISTSYHSPKDILKIIEDQIIT